MELRQSPPFMDDDLLEFMDAEPESSALAVGDTPDAWRILVVDDDPDVHESTAYGLRGLDIEGRRLHLLHAHSAADALTILRYERDVAVVLLDVVMETDDAGLTMVTAIRGELGMTHIRIILRTGQPGQAPEIDTIRRYDINDYKTKSELTRTKLYTTLTTSIRSYDQLRRLDALYATNLELVARLRDYAFVDRLLGLPNRTAFVQHLDDTSQSGLHAGQSIGLMDVDQFAETNDMFGHVYGDLLLAAIARRLAEVHAGRGLLARVAGDTFALLGDDAWVNPRVLRAVFEEPFEIEGVLRPVSICMGFVRCDDAAVSGLDLLKNASIALKRAKESGQGRSAYYSLEVGVATRERTRLLHGLQKAFDHERLFVVYQPQVSLQTGRPIGVEALVRWRTEDGQFVPPDQFIPVAEQSGLIVAIGAWVLRTSLHAIGQLRARGITGIRVAVNVSSVQFAQVQFLAMVDEALRDTGISPDCLELEITESVAVMGMVRVAALLREIKARGIAVAIDDFGTGFSSLSYLDQLPADRLKIDRAFVTSLDSGRLGARIAEMIVPLGHQLGMLVLAEGVETEAQATILRDLGCDEAQGYLYAKPMPIDELLLWLEQRLGTVL